MNLINVFFFLLDIYKSLSSTEYRRIFFFIMFCKLLPSLFSVVLVWFGLLVVVVVVNWQQTWIGLENSLWFIFLHNHWSPLVFRLLTCCWIKKLAVCVQYRLYIIEHWFSKINSIQEEWWWWWWWCYWIFDSLCLSLSLCVCCVIMILG